MLKKTNIPWQQVSDRLNELGKTPLWLRTEMQVAPNVLTNWKTRGIPTSKAAELAAALDVSTDELLAVGVRRPEVMKAARARMETFDTNAKPAGIGHRAVPVISAIQAGALTEITEPYSIGDGASFIYVDDDYSKWAFALVIDGNSMTPEFQSGDLVIIEPEWKPRPGEYVAAKNGKEEATFKKYRLRGSDSQGNDVFELVPLNEDYPIIRSDETPLSIIGVMAEHRRKARRR